MAALNYPLLEEDRLLRSKILFQAFEVDGPSLQGFNIGTFSDVFKDITVGSPNPASGPRPDIQTNLGISQLAVSAIEGNSAALYLPTSFTVQDNLSYEQSNLNASGAAVLGALNAGSSALGAAAQGIEAGFESIGGLFNSGMGGLAARVAASRAARSPLGAVLPEGVRNSIGLAARVTVNPNVRTTFRGVAIREFTFQFKFFPKSAKESEEVKNIIRMFRLNAYPEEIGVDAGFDFPVGYKYPNIFKIKLLSGVDRQGFRNVGTPIKMSHLRSISTVYNPTTQVFHADGSPTEIDLSLSFTEYKTISRKDIENEENTSYYEYYGALSERSETQIQGAYNRYADGDN